MFGLDYSLQPSLFQVVANGIRVEKLVDDVGKLLGHLNSILCFMSRDEINSMMNVGRGKLGWTTTNRFLKGRMLCRTESRDSSNADTCARYNGMNRMASIKLKEDGLLLFSRKRLHDGSG